MYREWAARGCCITGLETLYLLPYDRRAHRPKKLLGMLLLIIKRTCVIHVPAMGSTEFSPTLTLGRHERYAHLTLGETTLRFHLV